MRTVLPRPGPRKQAAVRIRPVMAWEHALLGDVSPARIAEAAAGDVGWVAEYRGLLAELGRAPRILNEGRLRASHPQLDTVRLPGSGLVVTLGELNVLLLVPLARVPPGGPRPHRAVRN